MIDETLDDILYQGHIAYNNILLAQSTIVAIEEALDKKDYSRATIGLILNNIETIKTSSSTSREPKHITALEDIELNEATLLAALEESRGLVSKLMGFFREIRERFFNLLNRMITKLNRNLSKFIQDLKESKLYLLELKKEGKVSLKDLEDYITDDSMIEWNSSKFLSFLMINKKDVFKNLNGIMDTYCDPKYPERFGKALTDFLDKEKYDKLYDIDLYKLLDNYQPFYKLANKFCPSGKDDRLILGFTNSLISILERCKMFGVKSTLMPYRYTIQQVIPMDASKEQIDTTFIKKNSIDDLIKLIDKAISLMENADKYENRIHDLMGDKISNDITDKLTWENKNFYDVYSQSILMVAVTYEGIFLGVDGFIKVLIQNLKKAEKNKK